MKNEAEIFEWAQTLTDAVETHKDMISALLLRIKENEKRIAELETWAFRQQTTAMTLPRADRVNE